MNKDRVEGAAQRVGVLKQTAGKITGDSKPKAEGRADKVAGAARNALGGAKDALKDKNS